MPMQPRRRPPDILMVTIEHLPARHLGCYGNPVVRTPHLDRLATEGALFEHATVASPLCVPSRTAMFTGRYPSTTGCRDNTLLLPPHEVHLPGLLSQAGYVCGLFGKNHCFPEPLAAGFTVAAEEGPLRARQRAAWGQAWPPPPVPIDPAVLAVQPRRFKWGEHPLPLWSGGRYPIPAEQAPPRANVDQALAFLSERRDSPAFTWLSFADPHPPFRPPAPYDSLYRPEALPLPPRVPDELARKPAVQQVYYFGGWHYLMDDAQVRMATALYNGALTYIDDCLGVLFDALRAQGRLDDTVILVSGDHGEFLGEHGLSRKCAAFYDCLVQVPLLVRGLPGAAPGTRYALPVELVDIFPTLLAVAGSAAPPRVHGQDLATTLAGRIPPREASFCEVGSRQPLAPGALQAALRDALAGVSYDRPLEELPLVESGTFFLSRGRMIRTPEWKYAHYVDDTPELYNLRADPWELENLAGRPEHRDIEQRLRTQLLERTIAAGDPR
ncbi:MAG: sulfatase-like hydrolase/transferase [Chloroflexi bacterium]|nr:sulfatase-like hydrolase/transferase [Chloroflexota bacterium]